MQNSDKMNSASLEGEPFDKKRIGAGRVAFAVCISFAVLLVLASAVLVCIPSDVMGAKILEGVFALAADHPEFRTDPDAPPVTLSLHAAGSAVADDVIAAISTVPPVIEYESSIPPGYHDSEELVDGPITEQPQTDVPPEEPVQVPDYNFANAVPECEPVEGSFFEDAVFIGDSRVVGFSMHSGIKAIYYGLVGLNVSNLDTLKYLNFKDENGKNMELTALEALEQYPHYSKVYISLGINEIGWPTVSGFIGKYRAAIQKIKEIRPDVDIYIQAIIPMSAEASDTRYKDSGNPRIREFNESIALMCEEEEVYFLDLYSHFADETGSLPEDASSDGIHMVRNYYIMWGDYLKSHVVLPEEADQGKETEYRREVGA